MTNKPYSLNSYDLEVLEPTKEQADEASNRLATIRQLKRKAGEYLYGMGKELYLIYREYEQDVRMAKMLFGFISFNSLVSAPEESGGIDFDRTTAYRFMRLYKKYELELGCSDSLQDFNYTKLDMIRNVVTEKNMDDWLSKAKSLSPDDLRIEVNKTQLKPVKEFGDDSEESEKNEIKDDAQNESKVEITDKSQSYEPDWVGIDEAANIDHQEYTLNDVLIYIDKEIKKLEESNVTCSDFAITRFRIMRDKFF